MNYRVINIRRTGKTGPKPEDLTGRQFVRLTVVKKAESKSNGKARWLCRCECGRAKITTRDNLKRGYTQSCGCLHKENFRKILAERNFVHGLSKHYLYKTWKRMKSRCYNPDNKSYKWYGARGIKICRRWLLHPKLFVEDALKEIGEKPGPNYTIDRINNDGNYEPGNIRWATPSQQCFNRRGWAKK